MKRWSREFDDPYTTKLLYVSLVRPSIEYCSCIWSPQISCYQNKLESVQKQFPLFALRGLNWDTGSHARLRLLDLRTLNHRRKCYEVMFLHKLSNGDVDSPFLLISLNWNVPCRIVRRYRPLSPPICRSNCVLHDPFRVLCDDYNALCHSFLFESPNATNYDKLMHFLSSNNL